MGWKEGKGDRSSGPRDLGSTRRAVRAGRAAGREMWGVL